MAHDPSDDGDLGPAGIDRRRFVTRVVVGSAIAAPVVSSFSMNGVNAVFAQDTNVSGGPAVEGSDSENTDGSDATDGGDDGSTGNTDDGGVSNGDDGGTGNTDTADFTSDDGGTGNTDTADFTSDDGGTGNVN